MIELRLLAAHEAAVLDRVAPDLFDAPIRPAWAVEFLTDPRHHLVVALDGTLVVGFVSAVHYLHPDKPPELFLNEVAVAPTHQNRGLGRALVRAMLDHGRTLGCVAAWVLTSAENEPARRLYAAAGGREAEERPTDGRVRADARARGASGRSP